MRPVAGAATLFTAFLLTVAAARAAEWRSEQPVVGSGVTALGEVGDIEFQAPNRGMLITAGNGGVQPGLFANDGAGWYRYATVCGGHSGRIAWAGPDDFWTISDQQAGQETGKAPPQHISLCHFKDGQVVASYGQPVGLARSYLPMDAAACTGPADCWFAGQRLPGTVNQGAFHLHWDGSAVTATPSLTDPEADLEDPGRTVTGLAVLGGSFYESVAVEGDDVPVAEETAAAEPAPLHLLSSGTPTLFEPLFPASPVDYGAAGPAGLEGWRLTADGETLWAVAGARDERSGVTVLRFDTEGNLGQLPLSDPEVVLGSGYTVGGAAAEPDADAAWVGFRRAQESFPTPARLTRIGGDGGVGPEVRLPAAGEGIGAKGAAGPTACAGPEQCWMATERGWLFHLGPDVEPNTDPAMHGPVITFRPPDESLPTVPPIELPEDDSGAEGTPVAEEAPIEEDRLPHRKPALLTKVKPHMIHGTVLELTFVLRAKAHVRLVAWRQGRVVAKTKRYTMAKGHRSLRLPLDPAQWPTKLDLQAHEVKVGGSR